MTIAQVMLASCGAVSALVAQSGWLQRAPLQSPPPRGFHGLAYDLLRGETVLFGGWDNIYLGDTWTWNGTSWTQRLPANAPPARLAHAMAADLTRGRVVVFGGAIGSGSGNDDDSTWEWDGTNWLQVNVPVAPSPRRGASMTFDPARGVCVLFGGGVGPTGSPVHDDTWEWNGVAWLLRTPAVRPPARWNPYLAADWSRGHVVMFGGGIGSTTSMFADTWTWDGVNWTQRAPAASRTVRRYGAAAYDVIRGAVVAFGGIVPTFGATGDTWLWDGLDWRRDTRPPQPQSRWATAAAFDLQRGCTVLFGGYLPGVSAETWEYQPGPLAQWTPFGTACAGPAGTPTLVPVPGSRPVAGTPFSVVLNYGTGSQLGVVAFGGSNQFWGSVPLPASLGPIGMPGCTVSVSLDVLTAVSMNGGSAGVGWQLPSTPAALGFAFHMQGVVFDAAANPFGAVTTAAGTATIGAL